MKKHKLSIILLMMSYSIFSQSLKPTVQKIGNDTVYCFTTYQTKAVAKLIINGIYSDSITRGLEKENTYLYQVIQANDSLIQDINSRLKVIDSLNNNQGQLIEYQRNQLEVMGKDLKRTKRHKIVLGSILIGVLILAAL